MIQELGTQVAASREKALGVLQRLVNTDSGSRCKAGVDACGQIVARELEAAGFRVETLREADSGSHVVARKGGRGSGCALLLAHLDTVWGEGTAAQRPFRVSRSHAYGPGVGDMKGGIVVMLAALSALQALELEAPPMTVFLTGDEEMGSVRARRHIEAEAGRSSWAFVMESPPSPASLVVRRWGVGAFDLWITGRAAHVLDAGAAGVNACRELAFKILALEGLSDPLRGIKVSVNLVRGGEARQMSAPQAWANVDVRVRDLEAVSEVESAVREVCGRAVVPGISLRLEGAMTRPPLTPNAGTQRLLGLASEVAARMGEKLIGREKAGGSDGAFTSALGVPTLDGLGPVCRDLYGERERIHLGSMDSRAVLLAEMLRRLAHS